MLKNKKIVLGISGSIAAYKAAELASTMTKSGAEVQCVMTEGACQFITPLTLQTLTGRPVMKDMFEPPKTWNVEHVALGQWADAFLIVPATANVIGKMAQGLADDLLTASLLACPAPIILAPAMNTVMYQHPAVQENLGRLKERGCWIVEPAVGNLACGDQGRGRLAPLDQILDLLAFVLEKNKVLMGKRLLVSAGPTQEALDPVRFISNHSSGKMGYALAKQAWLMGAEVTLVSGPVAQEPLPYYTTIPVKSAQEMAHAVLKAAPEADIIIKAAAVADYTPVCVESQKIKKQDGDMEIQCQRTQDILQVLGENKKPGQVLVGFAAETQEVLIHAAKKLEKKNADMIVANDITQEGAGFHVDTNIVTLLFADGTVRCLPRMSKEDVAVEILESTVQMLQQKQAEIGSEKE